MGESEQDVKRVFCLDVLVRVAFSRFSSIIPAAIKAAPHTGEVIVDDNGTNDRRIVVLGVVR